MSLNWKPPTLEDRVHISQPSPELERAIREKWGPTYQDAVVNLVRYYPVMPTSEILARAAGSAVYVGQMMKRLVSIALIPDKELAMRLTREAQYAARETYLRLRGGPLTPEEIYGISRLPSKRVWKD